MYDDLGAMEDDLRAMEDDLDVMGEDLRLILGLMEDDLGLMGDNLLKLLLTLCSSCTDHVLAIYHTMAIAIFLAFGIWGHGCGVGSSVIASSKCSSSSIILLGLEQEQQ